MMDAWFKNVTVIPPSLSQMRLYVIVSFSWPPCPDAGIFFKLSCKLTRMVAKMVAKE
jgi:hypothetical protein